MLKHSTNTQALTLVPGKRHTAFGRHIRLDGSDNLAGRCGYA